MQKLKGILFLIRCSGLRHIVNILWYTLFKERLDRQVPLGPSEACTPPESLIKMQPLADGSGAIFSLGPGVPGLTAPLLEIRFLTPELVRCNWEPGELPLPYALAKEH